MRFLKTTNLVRGGGGNLLVACLAALSLICSVLVGWASSDDPSSDSHLRATESALASWISTTLDSAGDVGYDTSIEVDSDDKVHVSYLDFTNNDLKYATNAGGSWVNYTLDSAGEVGLSTSLAVDSNDRLHVSYLDWTNGDLKYATNSGGAWAYQTIDSLGSVGMDTSIAVDSSNRVHISYLDWTNYDLKYATDVGGSWATYTLDSVGDVGFDTSIAVDSSDRVHISYSDWTNEDLKYATNAGGSWAFYTLDSEGFVGYDTSIAVDSNDTICLTYHDETNAHLKYATNAGGSWATYTLDSVGNVGLYTSIALDSANAVHISYNDYTDVEDGDLKYVTNAGGSWTSYTLASTGDVGLFSSIAVDSNRRVHISHCDYTDMDLEYVYGMARLSELSVSMGANMTSGQTSLDVQFSSSVNGGLEPYNYYWTFGDGLSDSAPNPLHRYSEEGTYTVTLVVTDSVSNLKTVKKTMRITEGHLVIVEEDDLDTVLMIILAAAIGLSVASVIVFSYSRKRKAGALERLKPSGPLAIPPEPGPHQEALAELDRLEVEVTSREGSPGAGRPALIRTEDKLFQLRSMKDKGLISEQEYEERKKELIKKW